MGDVLVKAASVSDGKIRALRVALAGLGERTIDRETAIAWLKDGHSLIPFAGARGAALQLVEVGDDDQAFVRTDNAAVAEDALPALPEV